MPPTLNALDRDGTRLGALCCLLLVAWLQISLSLHHDEHEDGNVVRACDVCVVLEHIGHALPSPEIPLRPTSREATVLPRTTGDGHALVAAAYHSRAPPRHTALT